MANPDYCKNHKFSDGQKIAVTILKSEQCGFTIEKCIQKMETDWTAKKLL